MSNKIKIKISAGNTRIIQIFQKDNFREKDVKEVFNYLGNSLPNREDLLKKEGIYILSKRLDSIDPRALIITKESVTVIKSEKKLSKSEVKFILTEIEKEQEEFKQEMSEFKQEMSEFKQEMSEFKQEMKKELRV